jgi:hypothetical protein
MSWRVAECSEIASPIHAEECREANRMLRQPDRIERRKDALTSSFSPTQFYFFRTSFHQAIYSLKFNHPCSNALNGSDGLLRFTREIGM